MMKQLQIWLARRKLARIATSIEGARLERRKVEAEYMAELAGIDKEIDGYQAEAHKARRHLAELERPMQVRSAFQ